MLMLLSGGRLPPEVVNLLWGFLGAVSPQAPAPARAPAPAPPSPAYSIISFFGSLSTMSIRTWEWDQVAVELWWEQLLDEVLEEGLYDESMELEWM